MLIEIIAITCAVGLALLIIGLYVFHYWFRDGE